MIIYPATAKDWTAIASIAEASWRVGYAGILAEDQIDFMLQRSYINRSFQEAFADGESFYILLEGETAMGFIALAAKADLLRIEKLYLLPSAQGKGYGKVLLDFAGEHARMMGIQRLALNVNRGNVKAYNFYLHTGFKLVDTVDIPYFQYVLNDYVLEKDLVFSAGAR